MCVFSVCFIIFVELDVTRVFVDRGYMGVLFLVGEAVLLLSETGTGIVLPVTLTTIKVKPHVSSAPCPRVASLAGWQRWE
jgi:hypothetical protein